MDSNTTFAVLKYGHFTSKVFTDDIEVQRLQALPIQVRKQVCIETLDSIAYTADDQAKIDRFKQAALDKIDELITDDQFEVEWNRYYLAMKTIVPEKMVDSVRAVEAMTSAVATSKYYQSRFEKSASLLNKLLQEYIQV